MVGNATHHAGKTDHRADRQIELAGDHQQACADRDQTEIGGDLRPVHHAVEVEHPRVAGGQAEHDEHHHGAGERREFRSAEQMAEPGFLAHAFVDGSGLRGGRRARLWRVLRIGRRLLAVMGMKQVGDTH
ncbi:hypothetical protein QFZ96_003405 [Paraburkholderia youngii]